MGLIHSLLRFFMRFRYPVSLPEDIAEDLGIPLSNYLTFQELVKKLSSPDCHPSKLLKFMPREKAEEAFLAALKKERFHRNSLFSYYFNDGWMEFMLSFDEQSRLRRILVQHKDVPEEGFEISLIDPNQLPSVKS